MNLPRCRARPAFAAIALLLVVPCAAGYKAGRTAYERGDHAGALSKLTPAAEGGDARAQLLLGDLYAYGLGVDRAPSVASRWYRLAAGAGLKDAQYRLARQLAEGKGVEKNDAEAARWFKAAAEQGHVRATYEIAMALLEGRGVERNDAEAAAWLVKAAEADNTAAQVELGKLYLEGRGVERKPGEGVRWLRSAAAARNTAAMRRLARLHFEGRDVERDLGEARRLIGKPAADDYPELEGFVDSIEAAMSPEELESVADLGAAAFALGDYETAAYEWHRAGRRGDAEAQYRLALMYTRSYGVVQQFGEAYVWAKRAAARNHEGATELVDSVKERLDPDGLLWAEYKLEHTKPEAWDPRPTRGGEVYVPDEHPEISRPRVLPSSREKPVYPDSAVANRIEGKVILESIVLENGHTSHLRVLRCDPPLRGFEESALAAVQQWRYEPARKDGAPVAVFFIIVVDYELH